MVVLLEKEIATPEENHRSVASHNKLYQLFGKLQDRIRTDKN
jgi:hypothetical protein